MFVNLTIFSDANQTKGKTWYSSTGRSSPFSSCQMSALSSEKRDADGRHGPRVDLALALALFVVAAIFRLMDLQARNLWTDEAWVALAVLKNSPGEVLAAGKSTPPFYLLVLWALTQVFGGSEAVLRSLSFCFGLGTVLLFYLLARSLTDVPTSLLGLAAITFSPIMVYFSKELKQYSGDAFFAVLLVLLSERLRARGGRKGWLELGLAGGLGLGFSHSLVFVLPTVLTALWLALPNRPRGRIALLALGWGAAFVLLYFMFFRHQVDPDLVDYWSQDFPDFSGLLAFLGWLAGALHRYLDYFLGEYGTFWGAPLLVIGFVYLIRQGQGLACLYLAGPLLLALGAATLHRYPFMAHYGGSRLMLFSAPLLYLVVAAGGTTVFLFLWRHKTWRWLTPVLLGGILLVLKPGEMLRENFHPGFNRSQLKPLVRHLEKTMGTRDRVYVYYYAIHPFRYYYQGNLEQVYWGKSCLETGLRLMEEDDDEEEDGEEPTARCLWLISGHYPSLAYMETFARNLLGPDWRQTARYEAPGAVLYRFERQPGAVAKTRPVRPGSGGSGSPAPAAERALR
jgi:hypothetical protein